MLAETLTRNQRLRGMAILTCAALIVMLSPALSSAQSASITSDKTVGLDPMVCATTPSITLPPEGGDVTYCYTVTNTGDVTFNSLNLSDDHLGAILSSFPYTLSPGASTFITQTAPLAVTTTNVASWTAEVVGGPVATSEDSALVTVTPAAPGLNLVKTVGTDPAACAPTGSIVLPPGGGTVVYCYRATNTGNVTFTSHTLADSELGTLLNDFAYSLAPSASVFVTSSALITQTTGNTASWTASSVSPTAIVTAGGSALVTIEAPRYTIDLVKTVGTDPSVCAPTDEITLPPGGGTAVYCYEVTNTGNVTLAIHDLVDDQLGTLLSSFPYSLAPGASVFVTQEASITTTTVNSATWTASVPDAGEATDSDDAVVNVLERVNVPTLSPSAVLVFALLLCAAGLFALRRLT
jgi:hypothetical protein